MRASAGLFLLTLLAACHTSKPLASSETAVPARGEAKAKAKAPPPAELLSTDTAKTTVEGNTFIAPAGWRISVRGAATILAPPEGDSHLALVDVHAADPDSAVAAAWAAYRPGVDWDWPVLVANDEPDRDGWQDIRSYSYQTSPNERRWVSATSHRVGDIWTVVIYDMATATAGKRSGAVELVLGQLFPKGYVRESFAGKVANPLDDDRIAELTRFLDSGRKQLGIPGVSFGLIQGGKVVFAGGVGAREAARTKRVDADTLYLIASNTKALTTLMLAKLVDQGKLTWDTPVTSLLPSFRLGDAATTSQVLVKHLICACTGMPRQDYEWLFQFAGVTCDQTLASLATMVPTSEFGEMFQYSNPLAAAAGFVGGHVAFPELELGAAYDRAMQSLVFDPLGMKSTTFDFARAQRGNWARPHSHNLAGKPAPAAMEIHPAVIPVRPAGGAWSSVRDLLRYVAMELRNGTLPDGGRYLTKDVLLARRAAQVAVGTDVTYGMGLQVDTRYGTTIVHHGGAMVGYHSDMMWLPEHGVGAVILTNGNPGRILRTIFRRKLLEVLFDGRAEADADLTASAKSYAKYLSAYRKLLTIPAAGAEAVKLAARYHNDALGELEVFRKGGRITWFDFGEWMSEMASRRNLDGSMSFVTVLPGLEGFEFVVGSGPPRTLILRDAQHEYIFTERTESTSGSGHP